MTILVATKSQAGICVATEVPVATGNPGITVATEDPPKAGGVRRTVGGGESAARRNQVGGVGRKGRIRFVMS